MNSVPVEKPRRPGRLFRSILIGDMPPKGWGLVLFDLAQRRAYIAPVPLNVAARVLLALKCWLARPWPWIDGAMAAAHWRAIAEERQVRLLNIQDAVDHAREASDQFRRMYDVLRAEHDANTAALARALADLEEHRRGCLARIADYDQMRARIRDLEEAIEKHNAQAEEDGQGGEGETS